MTFLKRNLLITRLSWVCLPISHLHEGLLDGRTSSESHTSEPFPGDHKKICSTIIDQTMEIAYDSIMLID